MNFDLQKFLDDKSQVQDVSNKIMRESVTRIKRRKLLMKLSNNRLHAMLCEMSWCAGYRENFSINFSRQQNLFTELEAEAERRLRETYV